MRLISPLFKAHALGGRKWPNNGLTFDENRRLFASKDRDVVVPLVVKGLQHRFATTEPVKAKPIADLTRVRPA
jgi:hypothetical protein